ncbi:TPA: hypothetical protein ACKPX4_000221 [Pseudomonas aeruginosa]
MTEQRSLTIRACDQHGDIRQDLTQQAEAERPELWAVHAQGPDELYAAFSREDAEKHAAELNALPMPEGIAVGAVVVPSPWPEAEHWKYLAEQEREHVDVARAGLTRPSPAQAKQAERPEVVGVRYEDGTILSAEDCGIALEVCAKVQTPLMTVAQHERIVKAWIERWKAYIELSAKIAAQRDAAQAEVEALRAELQSQRERNTELIFKLGSATNGWGRCEKERDAALARVAELEKQQPAGYLRVVNGRTELADGPVRPADRSGGYATPWQAIYTRPVAQAQHSVPEEFIGRLSEFLAQRGATGKALLRELRDMLAAAPGKEVPQAWLDVQAERRRQITAEGWTPEHDDEHADGQMAQAAGCYALHAGGIGTDWPDGRQNGAALFWPWDKDSWKPTTPRRDLVKACALALAEIERLDRAAATQGEPHDV